MPLHRIYSVKGVFSADDKKVRFSACCPRLQTPGMPCLQDTRCACLAHTMMECVIDSAAQAIAEGITKVYDTLPLPKFYVVVVFIDTDLDSFFIGGKPNNRFVRIVTGHLART